MKALGAAGVVVSDSTHYLDPGSRDQGHYLRGQRTCCHVSPLMSSSAGHYRTEKPLSCSGTTSGQGQARSCHPIVFGRHVSRTKLSTSIHRLKCHATFSILARLELKFSDRRRMQEPMSAPGKQAARFSGVLVDVPSNRAQLAASHQRDLFSALGSRNCVRSSTVGCCTN